MGGSGPAQVGRVRAPLRAGWLARAGLVGLLLSLGGGLVQAEVTEVDNRMLEALVASGVPVVDIRRPDEWRKTGVVEGSHLLTFFDREGRYDARAWMEALARIAGPDDPVILICEVGGRSGVITRMLDTRMNYTRVHDVSDGIRAWIKAGKPTVPVAQ